MHYEKNSHHTGMDYGSQSALLEIYTLSQLNPSPNIVNIAKDVLETKKRLEAENRK